MSTESVISEIAAERNRQINEEGWTAEHDDRHIEYQLAKAGAAYAERAAEPQWLYEHKGQRRPTIWPWDWTRWKPSESRRRNLVKAAALIVAEIERIDRIAERRQQLEQLERELG